MWGAVAIGLGSMIGAGLFSVFGPAAAAAGDLLPVALAVAAVVAWCNARSSAQLAAAFPTAGGSYVYGRRMLGPWPGFVAGWGFVVGKTASCAAIALTIGHAVLPDPWARIVAVGAVVLVLGVNAFGITRTALASWVIVGFVLAVLVALLVATLAVSLRGGGPPSGMSGPAGQDGFGVLRAAGLLFFAFAGYARVATLGEEVRDPKRTIPRAITVALLVTLVVYGLVCAAVLTVLGTGRHHEHDSVAFGAGARHRPPGRDRLVVGVGVEHHQRAHQACLTAPLLTRASTRSSGIPHSSSTSRVC